MQGQYTGQHMWSCLGGGAEDRKLKSTLELLLVTPRACTRGKAIPSVRRLSVCRLPKEFSNILQADTSSTYNRVISFANNPILTFVYLIIRNTLQFSVLSGLSYYPV